MKLNEIQDLIKFVAKSGVSEVELETKDVKIVIKTPASKVKDSVIVQSAPQPVVQVSSTVTSSDSASATASQAAAPKAPAAVTDDESKYVVVKSPMIGTFYRSPSPDKPAFINIGDEVAPGKIMCIIEAMKLFNEVECEFKGKVVKVLVNDVSPVEYDQPLFLIDPA